MDFVRPVAIVVGVGVKREIRSVREAREFLIEWPLSRRGSAHSTATRACEAFMAGHLTVDQTRRAFVEFARMSHILWPEMDDLVAGRAMCRIPPRHI